MNALTSNIHLKNATTHPATLLLYFVICAVVFGQFFKITFNTTESLPHKIELVVRGSLPSEHGQLVHFNVNGDPFWGTTEFTKYVIGMPGDVIETIDRKVYINGEFISDVKPVAKTGERLDVTTQTGVIPQGHYYVHTDHKDSYDSRYKSLGLINEKDIRGTSIVLF